MDRMVSENNLSSSFQTTLAVGGALALVAGAVIHRHKDKLSSFLEENLVNEQMNRNVDWQQLTIPAQVRRKPKGGWGVVCFSKERNTKFHLFRRKVVLKHAWQLHWVHDHYIQLVNQRSMIEFLRPFMMVFKVGRDIANQRGLLIEFFFLPSISLLVYYRRW